MTIPVWTEYLSVLPVFVHSGIDQILLARQTRLSLRSCCCPPPASVSTASCQSQWTWQRWHLERQDDIKHSCTATDNYNIEVHLVVLGWTPQRSTAPWLSAFDLGSWVWGKPGRRKQCVHAYNDLMSWVSEYGFIRSLLKTCRHTSGMEKSIWIFKLYKYLYKYKYIF